MKKIVRAAARALGYDIIRYSGSLAGNSRLVYHASILSLLSEYKSLSIVIVGANDGKTNDPLYSLLSNDLRHRSRVILVEPQSSVIPHLRANFKFHPDHMIFDQAIGPDRELDLYAIRQDLWSKTQPAYSKGWDEYRAPTGITSFNRRKVENFARKFFPENEIDQSIECLKVKSSSLKTALEANGITPQVDVLQIDVEGFDDQVLMNCDLSTIRPKIILYESNHFPVNQSNALISHLEGFGYKTVRLDPDMLCILIDPVK